MLVHQRVPSFSTQELTFFNSSSRSIFTSSPPPAPSVTWRKRQVWLVSIDKDNKTTTEHGNWKYSKNIQPKMVCNISQIYPGYIQICWKNTKSHSSQIRWGCHRSRLCNGLSLACFASVYMGFRHLEMEIFMEKTSIKMDFDLIVYGKNIYIYYWKCYGF